MVSETVTHRDMLRRLSADEKRALTERSDRRGLVQLAGHLSLIGLCLWGNVVGEGAVRWAAMLGQGIGMVFLFTAMHECSHSTAFRSRWLNRAVGMLAGMTLLIGPRWFFYFHQDHQKTLIPTYFLHQHLNNHSRISYHQYRIHTLQRQPLHQGFHFQTIQWE